MSSLLEVCGVKKLLGYASGAALVIIKIVLVIVVCQYSIPLEYLPVKSINLSCIATAVGFGISAFHTSVLLAIKSMNFDKLKNLAKPLFLKQYIVTCLCIMVLIRYIPFEEHSLQWFKAIICPVILTLEFAFYKLFIEPRPRKSITFVTPEMKVVRSYSIKNPWALQNAAFTK